MTDEPPRDRVSADAGPDGRPATVEDAPRYDFEAIDLDSGSVHAEVVKLVGESRRVLELGPATGYMSQAFRDRGCTVVGVELDSAMAERASEFCERMVVGDIDELDFDAELAGDRFDAIVAADVLEHLRDPLSALERLRPFLAPGGFFALSVPNVAHGSVRLALLSGRFPYQEIGLLDRTHLHFFTRESLEELLVAAELGVAEMRRHELNIDASEVPFDDTAVPADLRAALDEDVEARTYQFVVKAVPMPHEGLRELQRVMLELTEARAAHERLADSERAAQARIAELELASDARLAELQSAFAQVSEREGELRRSLVDSHDQLLRRDAEVEKLRDRCEMAERDLTEQVGSRDEEIRRLRIRLGRILESPPARAWTALRHFPGVRRIVARRQAGFEAEVAQQKQSAPGG